MGTHEAIALTVFDNLFPCGRGGLGLAFGLWSGLDLHFAFWLSDLQSTFYI